MFFVKQVCVFPHVFSQALLILCYTLILATWLLMHLVYIVILGIAFKHKREAKKKTRTNQMLKNSSPSSARGGTPAVGRQDSGQGKDKNVRH